MEMHNSKIRIHAFKIKQCIYFLICAYNKIWYTFISQSKYGSAVNQQIINMLKDYFIINKDNK